jgi:glutamine cyclotransferase
LTECVFKIADTRTTQKTFNFNDDFFIASLGSNRTFRRKVSVKTIFLKFENGKPLLDLNELEYVKGEIWANVWHSEKIGKPNHIARIDPNSGKLLGWINLQGISPDDVERDNENTLNGIAYDETSDRIFVTGKKWRNLYEIKLKAQ